MLTLLLPMPNLKSCKFLQLAKRYRWWCFGAEEIYSTYELLSSFKEIRHGNICNPAHPLIASSSRLLINLYNGISQLEIKFLYYNITLSNTVFYGINVYIMPHVRLSYKLLTFSVTRQM